MRAATFLGLVGLSLAWFGASVTTGIGAEGLRVDEASGILKMPSGSAKTGALSKRTMGKSPSHSSKGGLSKTSMSKSSMVKGGLHSRGL